MHFNTAETLDLFIGSLLSHDGISRNTAVAYRRDIRLFADWLESKKKKLAVVMHDDIQHYLAYRSEKKYTARSNARFISAIRRYFRFLLREKLIEKDPAADIAMPKLGRYLPDHLNESEVECLLLTPDVDTATGLRDKAILELFYACGLRVSELVSLECTQLLLEAGCLRVVGKGNQERLVPMGEEAIEWITRYLQQARPHLMKAHNSNTNALFVSNRGNPVSRQSCWYMIKNMARKADITKHLSPHTLRHAFATHLLDHGADLRTLQMLLGHKDLSTTQIYTHIADQRIKDLHSKHHPRG